MRPLADGDIINIDISVFYKGFHGDLNETFFVGKVDEDSKTLVKTAYEATMAAIETGLFFNLCAHAKQTFDRCSFSVRPGVMFRDFGETITKICKKQGYKRRRVLSL